METLQLWPQGAKALNDGATDGYVPVLEFYPSTAAVPDPKRGRPALVIFPGGAYAFRSPHEGKGVAEQFTQYGFHCFVVEYRVTPHFYPAPIQDGFRAIQLVRSGARRFGIDPHQVATIGFSAGGHLCAAVGTMFGDETIDSKAGDDADQESRRPDATGLGYAVLTAGPFAHHDSIRNLLGPQYPALCNQMSIERRVTKDTPPMFLWTTATDNAVPVQNSLLVAEIMLSHQLPFELHIFPEGAHGLGLAQQLPGTAQWPELYRTFLRGTMKFNC